MVEVIVVFKIVRRSPAPLCSFTKNVCTHGLAPGACLSSSSHMGRS